MQISGGKGRPPPTIFGTRKVKSLGYRRVKKIAENCNQLSRVHQRYRQTDRQTDRQTTNGRAMAYSERERKFTSAKKPIWQLGSTPPGPTGKRLEQCLRKCYWDLDAIRTFVFSNFSRRQSPRIFNPSLSNGSAMLSGKTPLSLRWRSGKFLCPQKRLCNCRPKWRNCKRIFLYYLIIRQR